MTTVFVGRQEAANGLDLADMGRSMLRPYKGKA